MQHCIYMFNTFTYMCVMFKYICSMFGEYFYSMSSGYMRCLPENGIMGNLKASETTALIGSLRWRQKSEILVVLVLLLV